MTPKSKVAVDRDRKPVVAEAEPPPLPVFEPGQEIPIKEIECFNDSVAILQFRISSKLELTSSQFKQEGMVVGVGPGLPTSTGTRCPSQLKLGKVVSFYGTPAAAIEPAAGVYKGQRIIIITERMVLTGLPEVPFRIVEELPK